MKRELTVLALLVSALCLSTDSLARTKQGSDIYGNSTYGFGSGYPDKNSKLRQQLDQKAQLNARGKVYVNNLPQTLKDRQASERVQQEALRLNLAENYLKEHKANLSPESKRDVEMYIEESRNKLALLKEARQEERNKLLEREFRNKDDLEKMTEVEKRRLYKRYGLDPRDYGLSAEPAKTRKRSSKSSTDTKPFFSN